MRGGRGRVSVEDGPLSPATLVRLSIPGEDAQAGVVAEPTYGTQLQPRSTALSDQLPSGARRAGDAGVPMPPEGSPRVRWVKRPFKYPDGKQVELRRPEVTLEQLGYGALHSKAKIGLRHTPPLTGLGLLALIEQKDIERLTDPDDTNGDGISGRQNQVWDPVTKRTSPGRFGHKANQPTLRVQVAAALSGDIGITSTVFPQQPCTKAQADCARVIHGAAEGEPEIADRLLDLITGYVASIGVPKRRKPRDPMVLRGRELFYASGCAACHHPSFVTGSNSEAPHLSGQEIWPYTDLLLHDMGDGLSDGRPDYLATGSEWRTPPLWGVGLARGVDERVGFLHDGRARTVEEAVLWHAGEARPSRDAFTQLPATDRRCLLAFVKSL